MSTTENNRQTALTVNELFAKGNPEELYPYFTDDIRWEMVGDMTAVGKQEFKQVMESQPFESGTIETYSHLADGDRVAIEGYTECKRKDGSVFKAHFTDIYTFRDGKIAEIKSYIVEKK